MAGWEEIERLKSDFKLVQLSSTKQKLSERNVIEIVRKLIDLKLIDVIYTLDGKEYLTPQGLTKEIQDELVVHGGRINLVELQQILNVDFSHIESKASEIVKHDRNITLVLGQLIDNTYLDRIAEEVNDRLQEQGHITIAELTQLYDLPADFLSENIHERVGTIIKGQVDSYDRDIIFTDYFILRMKAQIKGSFSAVTGPVQMTSIMNRYGFQERLFYSILEELVASKRLMGTISGGRQEKALYIPDIYTKSQNDWVDSFYKQNGYLEYDSLTRLGITDPKSFIKKRFKSEPITYLSTCCAGSTLKEQMEASAEDALQSESWVDILPLLPSVFSGRDANQILTECIKKLPRAVIYCETIVASEKLIANSIKPFEDLVKKKAEKDAKSNPALFNPESQKTVKSKLPGADDGSLSRDDKKEQRKKKAASSSKSGGGTQGREVKTKSVKKKGRGGGRDQRDDSDEEGPLSSSQAKEAEIVFMTIEEIEKQLKNQKELRDCPEEFLTEIAQQLYRPLSKQYQEAAKSIFLQTSGADTGTGRKKTHGELQEKLLGLWQNCLIFDKGLKNFTGDTQTHLAKHLLKTVCTDITNIVVNAFGTEYMLSVADESQLTLEGRVKIISALPSEVQSSVTKLHTSLNEKTVDEFFSSFEVVCGPSFLGLMLKKPDKRKERQLIFNHRQVLIEQLTQETDPAMTLHLSSVILFHTFTQSILHAPGKCVPQILSYLQEKLEQDKFQILMSLHDMVVRHMKLNGDESKEDKTKLETEMQELLPQVKDFVLKTKKGGQAQEEQL